MQKWRVFITPAAERVVKKLPQEARHFVLEEFSTLVKKNPFIGEQLSGPLSWLRSFHFSVKGKPYRVAYEIKERELRAIIHYADYRGGFYERLRRTLS